MSNVVSLGLPRRPALADRQGLLLQNFACNRRSSDDVFWLKENAEVLNVLASSGAALLPAALVPYEQVYHGLEERLRFFPQYYRFLLSICLDLEDLGMEGDKGEALCSWVAEMGLVEAELSDLQRAEAHRLMARRGVKLDGQALHNRLRAFVDRSETFALPNKKATYELTHIVFYLSDYGRTNPRLGENAIASLEYAGLLAFLDQDIDLLAEICVAMRFAGQVPSEIWESWIAQEMGGFVLTSAGNGAGDCYHEYLVTSWWAQLSGRAAFPGVPTAQGLQVRRHTGRKGPLRAMSEYMFHLGPARSRNWAQMRDGMAEAVGSEGVEILSGAERSSERFSAFFEDFSRAEV